MSSSEPFPGVVGDLWAAYQIGSKRFGSVFEVTSDTPPLTTVGTAVGTAVATGVPAIILTGTTPKWSVASIVQARPLFDPNVSMATQIGETGVKKSKDQNERRASDRFPIEREVRYKILNRKSEDESGTGVTVNMSSNGVLFTTEGFLIPGRRVELAISWPAQLNSKVALKLVARGRVVRAEDGHAAIEIQQHEFRTQGSQPVAK
jgi:hypothetical protein